MADTAKLFLEGDNADLQEVLGQSLGAITSFGNKVVAGLLAVGGIIAAKKLFNFGASLVKEASDAQEGIAILEQTLDNLGDSAAMTSDEVLQFAEDMSRLTKFTDDAYTATQTLFLRLESLDETNIKRATRTAADFAASLKEDLPAATTKLVSALKDPERGINSLRAAGIKFSIDEENMVKALIKASDEASAQEIILAKLESTVGGTAERVGQTAEGQWAIFLNRLGEVGESIGTALIPILEELTPVLGGVAEWIETAVAPAVLTMISGLKGVGEVVQSYLGPVLNVLLEGGVQVFTGVQTAIENWRDLSKLALAGFLLSIVKTFEVTKWWLTEAMPAYLKWFGENWRTIFKDVVNITSTVFTNLWTNAQNFWNALMGLFSGEGFNFNWTPLLEGFEAATKKMPEIAARQKGATEEALESSVAELSAKLGSSFQDNLAKNRAKVGLNKGGFDFSGGVSAPPPPGTAQSGLSDQEKNARLVEAVAAGQRAVAEEGNKKKDKDKSDSKAGGFEGLTELNKRIASAAAGVKKDPTAEAVDRSSDRSVSVAREQLRRQDETNDLLRGQITATAKLEKAVQKTGGLK